MSTTAQSGETWVALFTRDNRFVCKQIIPNCRNAEEASHRSCEASALHDLANRVWLMPESAYAEESQKILIKSR